MTKKEFQNTTFKKGMKVKQKNETVSTVLGVDFAECIVEIKCADVCVYSEWISFAEIECFIY